MSLVELASSKNEVSCGVPLESKLGPTIINVYMLPLGNTLMSHNIMTTDS